MIDYLRSMGYSPAQEYGNRWTFVCPIHKDQDPSFMVYKNDCNPSDPRNYQSYYCWGCKRSGDIISLKAELEYGGKNGWGSSIAELSKGMDLSLGGEMDFILNELKKELQDDTENGDIFENTSLMLSTLGFQFFQEANFDPHHLAFMESVYKKIDKYSLTRDAASIKEASEFLVDDGKLFEFHNKFLIDKEKEEATDGED